MPIKQNRNSLESKEMFRFAQLDKIPRVIASERRERGNQQSKNPNQVRMPTRLIASALPRNDKWQILEKFQS
ncbi:MAG: hypothetical protein K2N70_00045 [Helicobacter sp.]|nr:hypothetical protein [Helicobacter sp.]